MLSVKELQIGSYFINPFGNIERVMQLEKDGGFNINGWGEKDCNGVPITPELLEKCGFEKLQDDGEIWMEKQVKIGETTIIFSEGDRNGFCEVFICGMDDVRVQSLHRLQSLYLSVTGTKLNVQL